MCDPCQGAVRIIGQTLVQTLLGIVSRWQIPAREVASPHLRAINACSSGISIGLTAIEGEHVSHISLRLLPKNLLLKGRFADAEPSENGLPNSHHVRAGDRDMSSRRPGSTIECSLDRYQAPNRRKWI